MQDTELARDYGCGGNAQPWPARQGGMDGAMAEAISGESRYRAAVAFNSMKNVAALAAFKQQLARQLPESRGYLDALCKTYAARCAYDIWYS